MAVDVLYMVPNASPRLLLDETGDGLTFWKELIYEGSFTKAVPGQAPQHFTIDQAKIDHWATTGNRMVKNGVKIPLPLKHNDNPEANRARLIEYATDVNDSGLYSLWGKVRFNNARAAELAASTDVSIFVPGDTFVDGRGNSYEYAIKHIALTDYPVIPGLSDFHAIAASYDGLELSGSVPQQSRGAHLGMAALHGGIGYLEATHAIHLAKHLAKPLAKHFAKKGIVGVTSKIAATGLKAGLRRYAIPAALAVAGVHGTIHGVKAVAQHLHGAAKAPTAPKPPTALSLAFKNSEKRAGNGRWERYGRKAAAAGVGGLAVSSAVKAVSMPAALIGIHALAKRAGIPSTVTKKAALQVAASSLGETANAGIFGAVAHRIAKPATGAHVAPKTQAEKNKHALHATAKLAGSGVLAANAFGHANYANQAFKATKAAFRHAQTRGTFNDKLLAHAALTRPFGLYAAGLAVGAGGLAYAANRARKSGLNNLRAAQHPIQASFDAALSLSEQHSNIKAREKNGRFGKGPVGSTTTRQVREMNSLKRTNTYDPATGKHKKEKYFIRDASNEEVHSSDKLTAGIQAAKHAALGAIEVGALTTAAHTAAHQLGKSAKKIWHSRYAHQRIGALKSAATALAAAAAISGVVHRRYKAFQTHAAHAASSN